MLTLGAPVYLMTAYTNARSLITYYLIWELFEAWFGFAGPHVVVYIYDFLYPFPDKNVAKDLKPVCQET